MNPFANFTRETAQDPPVAGVTPGPVLLVRDTSASDLVNLYADTPFAAPGTELDLVVTFKVQGGETRNGADTGVRFVINDGVKAIFACGIVKNGLKGIGLATDTSFSLEQSYPDNAFVVVDWSNPNPPTPTGRVTLRLRRNAQGDAEIVEVNGVAPNPRAFLLYAALPPKSRVSPSVELGCANLEAIATMETAELYAETPASQIIGALAFTAFRIRDHGSADRLRFRADYTLDGGTDGIDPSAEQVTIRLSTPSGGQFYPSPSGDFNPLSGFGVHGHAPRRRWSLNDSERVRTGIERLHFDENPNNTGAVILRDMRTDLPYVDYSTVDVEVEIGNELLTGMVHLVETPPGSGRWRLDG